MSSHNAKPRFSFHKTPLTTNDAAQEAKIISAKLSTGAELTIHDDDGIGGDPYNTTGQHIVLNTRHRAKK